MDAAGVVVGDSAVFVVVVGNVADVAWGFGDEYVEHAADALVDYNFEDNMVEEHCHLHPHSQTNLAREWKGCGNHPCFDEKKNRRSCLELHFSHPQWD